jgi:hypothetical protein
MQIEGEQFPGRVEAGGGEELGIMFLQDDESHLVAEDAGGGLVHGAQFGGGAVVESERAQVEVVVSPFVGDGVEHPGQVGGLHDHGRVDAHPADLHDEGGDIQRFRHLVLERDLFVEGQGRQDGDVGDLDDLFAFRNDERQRRGRVVIEDRRQGLTDGVRSSSARVSLT